MSIAEQVEMMEKLNDAYRKQLASYGELKKIQDEELKDLKEELDRLRETLMKLEKGKKE